MAQAASPVEAESCLAPPPRFAAWTAKQAQRRREVWSDSLWLIRMAGR